MTSDARSTLVTMLLFFHDLFSRVASFRSSSAVVAMPRMAIHGQGRIYHLPDEADKFEQFYLWLKEPIENVERVCSISSTSVSMKCLFLWFTQRKSIKFSESKRRTPFIAEISKSDVSS
ncbi:hypothetical protein AKJ16_DCAP02487 [Drosera capensis]